VGVIAMGAPSAHVTIAIAPLALSKPDAAAVLGMSVDSFERYVMPYVRCVRRGRLRLYPVEELRRWADENAERLLPGAGG
jgi:hypothetical protein